MSRIRFIICSILEICILALTIPVWAGVTDDIAPCVVFLMQKVPAGKEASIGTGFLIKKDDQPYLITASHVANAVGNSVQIVMPGAEGRAVIGEIQDPKWYISKTADVALILVKTQNNETTNRFLQRCLPADLLSARPIPPSREIPLTVMGYPLGLGATGLISPLSLETRAASGLITMRRFDNKQLASFILLQDPSIGGLSGGPVFDTGNSFFQGRSITVRSGVSVVGLVHGVIPDDTGGKFAAIVPSTDIVILLELAITEGKH